ncbi:MAG: hypothetical protein IPP48_10005 [Chitinophagaceae bacterium]|nr:hypothetical protein [Chitinophagaceae bacterium]
MDLFLCISICFLRDFKYQNKIDEDVYLSNPKVNQLEISSTPITSKYYGKRWLRIEPFNFLNEDSVLAPNIQVRIRKSTTDSFRVVISKVSNGYDKTESGNLAQKININITQKDSLLITDKGFVVNKTDKFRNQHVILTVYVPVGKKIKVNRNVSGWDNVEFDGPWVNDDSKNEYWNEDYDSYQHNWEKGKTYIMREDGLYNLDGEPANGWNNGKTKVKIGPGGIRVKDANTDVNIGPGGISVEDGGQDNYRYNTSPEIDKVLDSVKQKLEEAQNKKRDSLLKIKEEADKQLEKLGGGNLIPEEPLRMSAYKFSTLDPISTLN